MSYGSRGGARGRQPAYLVGSEIGPQRGEVGERGAQERRGGRRLAARAQIALRQSSRLSAGVAEASARSDPITGVRRQRLP